MKAIAYQSAHTLNQLASETELGLTDVELPTPSPGPMDLIVEVKAVALNPVDTKIRKGISAEVGQWKVLGWDCAGVVTELGNETKGFKVGDRVWYAGDISRQGCNAQFQAVDSRIVSRMPESLGFAEAAALPLTTLTAWELLFDRLQIPISHNNKHASILVVGAAGGVGSILVQLLNALTDIKIVATAARPESRAWLEDLGVACILNHNEPLSEELSRAALAPVDWVASLNNTYTHYPELIKCLKPQGRLGLIDDPAELDIKLLKRKSISLHWEFMFTRAMFNTDDIDKQHTILERVAKMVDAGQIKTTLSQHLGKINSTNLRKGHKMIEAQTTCGKLVLEGF